MNKAKLFFIKMSCPRRKLDQHAIEGTLANYIAKYNMCVYQMYMYVHVYTFKEECSACTSLLFGILLSA